MGTSRMKSGYPEADDESTYERLLAIAARLFRRDGYASTSTRALASELGVQKASLYYHIEGKEQLLYALAVRSMDYMNETIYREVEAAVTPRAKLEALVKSHVATMLERPDWHVATMLEMRALSEDHSEDIRQRRDAHTHVVAEILEAGQQDGTVRNDIAPRQLARIILGTMNWPFFWFASDGRLGAADVADLVLAVVLDGVAAPKLDQATTD